MVSLTGPNPAAGNPRTRRRPEPDCAQQANATVVERERAKPAAPKPAPPLPVGTGQKLSPRQLEFVQLIADQRTVRQIADEFDIGEFTVYGQLREARKRLGAVDNHALIAIARQAGLIPKEA